MSHNSKTTVGIWCQLWSVSGWDKLHRSSSSKYPKKWTHEKCRTENKTPNRLDAYQLFNQTMISLQTCGNHIRWLHSEQDHNDVLTCSFIISHSGCDECVRLQQRLWGETLSCFDMLIFFFQRSYLDSPAVLWWEVHVCCWNYDNSRFTNMCFLLIVFVCFLVVFHVYVRVQVFWTTLNGKFIQKNHKVRNKTGWDRKSSVTTGMKSGSCRNRRGREDQVKLIKEMVAGQNRCNPWNGLREAGEVRTMFDEKLK